MSLKTEVTETTAPLQTFGGLKGGVESSVHAVRDMYKDDATDCVLLVDAANAFNSLNRAAALQNVGVLCQPLHQYSIPQESIRITHKDGCQRNKKRLWSP